jgi:acyl-coenzyme A synthetase/AMP-(fatty) acid ligase
VHAPPTPAQVASLALIVTAGEAIDAETAAMATDLRLHVNDLIGGLAKPRTVAFVEAFPDGAASETLIRALQGLCAGTAAIRHIPRDQLTAMLHSIADEGG